MLKMLFSSVFYLMVGQWAYNELKVTVPWAVPVVDRIIHAVSLPTHDNWGAAKEILAEVSQQKGRFAHFKGDLKKEVSRKLNSALDTPDDFKF